MQPTIGKVISAKHAVFAVATLFFFVLIKNSWIADDAFVGLRQVEQFFAGNGLRWNPHERIQLFSSILGMGVLLLTRIITADPFLITAIGALLFNSLILFTLWRIFPNAKQWCTAVLLLLASKSYMDFSWSGLHNYVGHYLLALYWLYWTKFFASPSNSRNYLVLFALAGVSPLFRHDFVLFTWLPCAYLLLRHQFGSKIKIQAISLMVVPIMLWTLFSLVYFGLLLPQAAYLKLGTGLPRTQLLSYGAAHYSYMITRDLITLLVIGMAVWLLSKGKVYQRIFAIVICANLFYILYSGSTYMGGRFFTYAYFLAVLVVVSNWELLLIKLKIGSTSVNNYISCYGLGTIAVLWAALYPHSPVTEPLVYEAKEIYQGISDERSGYHEGSGVLAYIDYLRGNEQYYPVNLAIEIGVVISKSELPVFHFCNSGMIPYKAHLDQKFIELYGLSDVFQIFMPVVPTTGGLSRPAHNIRAIPAGYLESVATDTAVIENEEFNKFYQKIRLATQSEELFTVERLKAIFALNFTFSHKSIIDSFIKQRPTAPIKLPLLCKDLLCLSNFIQPPELFKLPLLCKVFGGTQVDRQLVLDAGDTLTYEQINQNSWLSGY